MENSKIVEECVRLFEKRFHDTDIAFEMICGYFCEWCDRIKAGNARSYADSETLQALKELKID